ncbi:MAG: histidine kinase [Actinobacteria bacterium]|nr:histidine kinase [Actinomycetota bacterium]
MRWRPGRSPVTARSFIVGYVSVDAQPGRAARPYAVWRTLWRLEAFISLVIGGGLALGWALTGAHGHFWPAWVWFGLGVPLWLQAAALWGLRVPRGRRFLALHLSVSFALAVMFLVIWMLAGFHYFWPVWPILGLSVLLALHVWMVRNRSAEREQALTDRVDVLTRTRRGALDIQAAELQRIERDLHDGAQARLVSVAMSLGLAESLLASKPNELPGLLIEARSTTLAALDDLRTVMRGIQPPVLADRGLEGAIRALALDVAVPVTVSGTLAGRPPVPVESAVYFTAAECLANVVKHSGATAATVGLRHDHGLLSVTVGDNGLGGARLDGGTGLLGVAGRLETFDGTLAISSPPGGPTTVTMEVPCELSSPKT